LIPMLWEVGAGRYGRHVVQARHLRQLAGRRVLRQCARHASTRAIVENEERRRVVKWPKSGSQQQETAARHVRSGHNIENAIGRIAVIVASWNGTLQSERPRLALRAIAPLSYCARVLAEI